MSELEWHGDEIIAKARSGIKDALLTVAADLQKASIPRAPIDTGKLRESCVVDASNIENLEVKVGYSPEVDAYSVVQHERFDFSHPRGGGPKFLENPFNENAKRYNEHIGRKLGEALR